MSWGNLNLNLSHRIEELTCGGMVEQVQEAFGETMTSVVSLCARYPIACANSIGLLCTIPYTRWVGVAFAIPRIDQIIEDNFLFCFIWLSSHSSPTCLPHVLSETWEDKLPTDPALYNGTFFLDAFSMPSQRLLPITFCIGEERGRKSLGEAGIQRPSNGVTLL